MNAELIELKQAADADSETGVVRYVTTKLFDILRTAARARGGDTAPPRVVLVQSENIRWLDHLTESVTEYKHQKPGLFVSWEPFVRFYDPKGKQGTGPDYYFGRLASRSLQLDGCVPMVMEGKDEPLTDRFLGELADYQSHLPRLVHGVLFNSQDFWLLETWRGIATKLVECQWDQAGTASLLHDHVAAALGEQPPVVDLLSRLLQELHVHPVQHNRSSCLGSGATGRVFAVQPSGPAQVPVQALKVVTTTGALLPLDREYTLLQQAAAANAPVIPPVAGSLRIFHGLGGGFVLTRPGSPYSRPVAGRTGRRIITSLHLLHTKGFVHGDSRLPNVLDVDGSPLWVDFLLAVATPATFWQQAAEDMTTLAASLIHRKPADLPAQVTAAISSYAAASTPSAAAAAAAEVADAVVSLL